MMNKEEYNIIKKMPKDYFGGNMYNSDECNAATKVIMARSPFRYYGNQMQNETEKFEKKCKDYFGVDYTHSVNSGTGAISCAFHALDISIGDEVIMPGYFWISIANVCLQRGAIPVLCDIDRTFGIDVDDLLKKITKKTKCIVVVHMDGAAAKIDSVRKICDEYNITLLEDFSQCIGGEYKGKKIGTFGDISIASLQLNKIITAGEGGIILTNKKRYYNKIVAKSDIGFERNQRGMLVENNECITYGEGRRFNEISAAIMNVQLKKIEKILIQLKENKRKIKEILGDITPVEYRNILDYKGEVCTTLMLIFPNENYKKNFLNLYMHELPNNELMIYELCNYGYHIYSNCTNLINKVDVLPGGFPWKWVETEKYNYNKGILKNADELFSRTIALKLSYGLSEQQVLIIAHLLKKILKSLNT